MNNLLFPLKTTATIKQAVILCESLYEKLSPLGFYPALTGGLLYKGDNRKDIDIVIFRNRQGVDSFEIIELVAALKSCNLTNFKHYGFVTKCEYQGLQVDLFNPETKLEDNEYGDSE